MSLFCRRHHQERRPFMPLHKTGMQTSSSSSQHWAPRSTCKPTTGERLSAKATPRCVAHFDVLWSHRVPARFQFTLRRKTDTPMSCTFSLPGAPMSICQSLTGEWSDLRRHDGLNIACCVWPVVRAAVRQHC